MMEYEDPKTYARANRKIEEFVSCNVGDHLTRIKSAISEAKDDADQKRAYHVAGKEISALMNELESFYMNTF